MSVKRLLLVALVGLVLLAVVGLLVQGGSAVRSSWTQGFLMGRLAGEGGGEGVAPIERYRPGHPGMWLGLVPVLCVVGLLLTVGVFLLPLAVIGVFSAIGSGRCQAAWMVTAGPNGGTGRMGACHHGARSGQNQMRRQGGQSSRADNADRR